METETISATEYGRELLIFTLLLAAVFFITTGVLNRLVAKSIADPLRDMLDHVASIQAGDYTSRIQVVSNDEIGVLGDAGNAMTRGLAEREMLRDAFGKYVTPEIRDEIISGRIPLDGEVKEVTLLFADLRDFTPLVDSLPVKEAVKMINGYFREMAAAIQQHKGLVLQFIGDEIEAAFGAPLALDDHPARAARAALEMRRRLERYNIELQKDGYAPLRHGIGIHTGQALAANIGSPDRLSYALVGDTVNLASRLQGLTKKLGHDIIISSAAARALGDEFTVQDLPATTVKGKKEAVEVFALL
jgi:class 3 adenylate cyclase